MVQGERQVTKETRANQEDQEDLDILDLKENLVRILKEDLVNQDNLAIQEEMEKMVLLANQDTLEKRETEEREILVKKISINTRKSCLRLLRKSIAKNVVMYQDMIMAAVNKM